jgi:twitching motility two-component system response regulator PilG
MQIRVKVLGLSESDELRLKKIFKLSASRKKQYILVEEKADILITANPAYQAIGDISVMTLGAVEKFPDSKAHIRPPLLGIRVLKALDAMELTQSSPVTVSETTTQIVSESIDESQNIYDILVVDDSILIHKALELELHKADFGTNITFVESGEACLDSVKDKKFDLVFLDVMMPGIDGYNTCTEIRKNPHYKKTPIIMLSGKTSPLDEVKGVMAGCTTYLTKPIKHEDFQKLLIRMDKWLENFNPSPLTP